MSTEIATNNVTEIAVPESLAAAFGDVESNITVGESIPHLSIKGKVWKVVANGIEKVMMMKDEDGEETPRPTVKVVILNQVPKRSRVYFKDDYVEGSNAQPDCWSINGDTPDSQVSEPQATACDGCPQSIKGSKVNSNGDAVAACGVNKRICVVPSSKVDFTPLLVKLPVTSLWEKEGSEEPQGWYAYDAYLKYLKAHNVPHTAMVETVMKFDSKDVSYPKVLFKYNGFIDEAKAAVVAPRVNSAEVMDTLGIGEGSTVLNSNSVAATEETVAEVATEDADAEAEKKAAEVAKKAKAQAAKEKAAKAAKAKAAKAAKAKAAKAAKAKAAKEEKAAEAEAAEESSVETAVDEDDLSDVLSDWD